MLRLFVLPLVLFACSKGVERTFDYSNTTPLTEYNYRKKHFLSQEQVIPYNSSKGIELFLESALKDDVFRLSPYFSGQNYISTCGPASLKIILAGLYSKIEKTPPLDKRHSFTKKKNGVDYFLFNMTEESVFSYIDSDSDYEQYDIIARQAKTRDGSYGSGMGGINIVNVAESHAGITAKYTPANRDSILITQGDFKKLVDANINCTKNCNVLDEQMDSQNIAEGIKKFRKDIISTMKKDDQFMIAYFSHIKTLPAKVSGHFSPIIAYNAKEDKALVMEVATHLGGWYWVGIEDLYKSMSYDLTGLKRGYVIIGLSENR